MKPLEPQEGKALAKVLEDELHTMVRYRSGCIVAPAMRDQRYAFTYADPALVWYASRTNELIHGPAPTVHKMLKNCQRQDCIYHYECI